MYYITTDKHPFLKAGLEFNEGVIIATKPEFDIFYGTKIGVAESVSIVADKYPDWFMIKHGKNDTNNSNKKIFSDINLEKWKEFSDLIDKHNKKLNDYFRKKQIEEDKKTKISNKDFIDKHGFSANLCAPLVIPYGFITKNEINFYEWLVGKLKI